MGKRTRAVMDYEREDLKVEYALTPEEKELCQNVTVFGADYLRHAKGWKKEAVSRFLARSEVQREVGTLKRQYEDRTGLQERTQFFAQLRINGMVPAALNVLARSLRGSYKNDEGKLIDPPVRGQYEAALQVLDRANIQGLKYAGNDQTPSIDARSVHIAMGSEVAGAPLDAEGRQRVAEVLNTVLGRTRAIAEAKRRVPAPKKDEEDDDGPSED